MLSFKPQVRQRLNTASRCLTLPHARSGINDTVFLDPAVQQAWITGMVQQAQANFLDGLNFDFEGKRAARYRRSACSTMGLHHILCRPHRLERHPTGGLHQLGAEHGSSVSRCHSHLAGKHLRMGGRREPTLLQ